MSAIFKSLRAAPVLSVTLVLVFGLGIGANCALFSVINSLLFRSLPYADPATLIGIEPRTRTFDLAPLARARTISGAGGFIARRFRISLNGAGSNVFGFRISPELPRVLGVTPILGSTFEPGDEAKAVVLLSYNFWRTVSGDPLIIGKTMMVEDQLRTIVGVMPPDFTLQVRDSQIFVPRRMTEGRLVARLSPGATIDQASAELEQFFPPVGSVVSRQPLVQPVARFFRSGDASILWILQAAVGLILLIACANGANILLVRGEARRREFAIRTALGASRRRILGRLVAENAVIGLLAMLTGLGVARASLRFVESQLPANVGRYLRGADALVLDYRVVLFAVAVCGITILLFGLGPALSASKAGIATDLRDSGAGSRPQRRRYGFFLLAAEVALAVTLLAASGLTLKSFAGLQKRDLGFTPSHLLRVPVEIPERRYPDSADRLSRMDRILQRVAGVPGVTGVGLVSPQLFPFGGPRVRGAEFTVPDRNVSGLAEVYTANPDYFRTVRIPLLQGRLFTAADTAKSTPVALLSNIVARRYWGDADPLGARIRLNSRDPRSPLEEVIGIVGDVRNPLGADVQPTAYRPYSQAGEGSGTLMIRTGPAPLTLASAVGRQIQDELSSTAGQLLFADMELAVADYSSAQRFTASIFAIFAALALLLAGSGVFAVMRHSVASRTTEIGIRIALGARPGSVVRLIVGRVSVPLFCGLVAGLAACVALRSLLAAQIYDLSPTDPEVLAGAVAVMALAGLVAALLPAWRASRFSPMTALKHE